MWKFLQRQNSLIYEDTVDTMFTVQPVPIDHRVGCRIKQSGAKKDENEFERLPKRKVELVLQIVGEMDLLSRFAMENLFFAWFCWRFILPFYENVAGLFTRCYCSETVFFFPVLVQKLCFDEEFDRHAVLLAAAMLLLWCGWNDPAGTEPGKYLHSF